MDAYNKISKLAGNFQFLSFSPVLFHKYSRAPLSITELWQCFTGRTGHVSSSCCLRLLEKKAQLSFQNLSPALGVFLSFICRNVFCQMSLLFSPQCSTWLDLFDSNGCSLGTPGHNWRNRGRSNGWIVGAPPMSCSWIDGWLYLQPRSFGTYGIDLTEGEHILLQWVGFSLCLQHWCRWRLIYYEVNSDKFTIKSLM